MNYLDVVNFETYIAGCANNSGVSVVWDKPNSTPRTDGKTMWLPRLTSVTSNEWLARIRYFVKHETSHIKYSDFRLLDKYRPRGLLALINNLIEDHRIDYLNDSIYRGDGIISNNFWLLYTEDIKKRAKSDDKELSEQQVLTLPLFVWDATLRTWISSSTTTRNEMASLLDSDGVDRLIKLEQFTDELLVLRTCDDDDANERVYDLSVRILKALYDADAEDYSDDAESAGKGTGKGDSSDGDDEDGGSESVADDVDRLIDVTALMKDMKHDHKPHRTGLHLEHEKTSRSGRYVIPKPSEYVVVKFPALHKAVVSSDTSYFRKSDVDKYITSNARPLANQLRIKLQTRSRDRYQYGLKKGKIHNGSLHRLLSNDDNLSTRVFRKRIVSDTTDTAVTLLVDCSGSMSGKKFEMACAGAGAMAEALRPLNISFNILGFTNTHDDERPIVWVFKDFNDKVTQDELIKRFDRASICLWENTDGDAIAYASYVLGQRKEHRKVLLVLSDGSPAGRDHAGDVRAYTKRVIEDIESTDMDIYGIGILDRNVCNYYKQHAVVTDLQQLAPTILSVLDRSI